MAHPNDVAGHRPSEDAADSPDRLPAAYRELLARMRHGRPGVGARPVLPPAGQQEPIRRASHTGPVPLSVPQLQLWLLDQIHPGTSMYSIPRGFVLTGRLDVDAFGRALAEVLRRHEALRTTFAVIDGEPIQTIGPPRSARMPVIDFRAVPAPDRRGVALARLRHEARRPFDLANGPLCHGVLFHLDDRSQIFFLNQHHVITDGWSVAIVFKELSALYNAFAAGRPSLLGEPALQYRDFALWQHEQTSAHGWQKELAYWRQQLAGITRCELPSWRPPRRRAGTHGLKVSRLLPAPLIARLARIGSDEQTTLFTVLVAAFQVLLARYIGAADTVIGIVVAQRTRTELEPLVGLLANMLVLRGGLTKDPSSFRAVLAATRETLLEAHAHQDLPFAHLVTELRPTRNTTHSPMVDVVFSMDPPYEPLHLGDVACEELRFDSASAIGPLTVTIEPNDGALRVTAQYRTELYDGDEIARLLAHFERLLDAIATSPVERLLEVPLLTESERALLASLNDTDRTNPHVLVQDLITRQAVLTPDAVAVSCGETSLTYAQLDASANQLARCLRRRGVAPERVREHGACVAIWLERSVEMVTALLAVLKCGAAYVPLDPTFPLSRILQILEDASCPAILTDASTAARLGDEAPSVLCVDRDRPEIAAESTAPLPSSVTPADLAYVIFTSGSTGRPKGVAIPHDALLNLLLSVQRATRIEDADRLLAVATLSFDLATLEILMPLMSGARLIVAGRATATNGGALHDALSGGQITMMAATPVTWRMLLAAGWRPDRAFKIQCGGDVLPSDLADQLLSAGSELWNVYAPTETTIYSTMWLATTGESLPPVGRPIANTQLHVLNDALDRAPIGVLGELHIAGQGVGWGYWKRPDLTAERFIPDPFSREPGRRMFKTGDWARQRTDGMMEVRGRRDNQIKLRGYRIELGEIEAVLGRHDSVQQVSARLWPEEGERARLVAYVVPRPGQEISMDALRQHLKQQVPEYMIPSVFVTLDRFPLTPSGKIDRRALPPPGLEARENDDRYIEPSTTIERTLAAVWGRLLARDRVGLRDDFFELGGHSLLATQLISRLREEFLVEVPLRDVFEHPTLGAQAALVAAQREIAANTVFQAGIGPRTPGQVVPLSFQQRRLWFLQQLDPASTTYHIPMALAIRGPLNETALRAAFRDLFRRHEALRTTYTLLDEEPVQSVQPPPREPLAIVDVGGCAGPRQDAVCRAIAHQQATRPFDLSRGPLVRAHLLRRGDSSRWLAVTFHHTVCDGWSLAIFIRELLALYEAFDRGDALALPALPVQYADYALWQRSWVQGDTLRRQLAFWTQQLTPLPPPLDLPFDALRPPVQRFRGALHRFALGAPLSAALRELSQREGATLFMTLLAAFQMLLAHYSGEDDIAVGVPVAGRTHQSTEALVGFFVNTLVFRTRLRGDPSYREVLREVRDVSLAAYAHQDVPFETLVEELHVPRDPARNPVFQVMFNLNNAPKYSWALPSIDFASVPIDRGGAKVDLSLFVTDHPDGALFGWFEYNTDLFRDETMAYISAQWKELLARLVEEPETKLGDLALSPAVVQSPEEGPVRPRVLRHRAVERAIVHRPPVEPFGVDVLTESVASRVARLAAEQPDAAAIETDRRKVTYRELVEAMDAASDTVRSLDAPPGARIALLFPHGEAMIGAMLGVLKSGAAYVPLDASFPRARLQAMLADVGVSSILADASLVTQANDLAQTQAEATPVITLDVQGDGRERRPAHAAVTSDHLAYVLYTSGSTGRPKGVMQSHEGLLRHVRLYTNSLGLRRDDRLSLLSSYGFDAAVQDIFGALLNGACVCPIDVHEQDAAQIWRTLADRQVTVLHLTPTVYRHLMAAWPASLDLSRIRLVVLGGEPAAKADFEQYRRHFSRGCVFVNGFGLTESTVALQFFADHDRELTRHTVPIGQPVPETDVLILNRQGRLAGPYAAGEIVIRSSQIALGYWNSPDQTAAAFVPDPLGGPGRAYRTGDLGRLAPDGTVESLGRRDAQVKIRGVRIEPEEVRARLLTIPGILEAVVLPIRDRDVVRLVAYVVSAPGGAPTTTSLRRALETQMPDVMMPWRFMLLDRLPLRPNGKVDHRALPKPPSAPPGAPQFKPPASEVERRLAAMWADLLRVPQVGLDDDFFDLGGHSLLATRLVSRLRDELGADLPLREIFEHPTLAELAAVVAALRSSPAESPTSLSAAIGRS